VVRCLARLMPALVVWWSKVVTVWVRVRVSPECEIDDSAEGTLMGALIGPGCCEVYYE